MKKLFLLFALVLTVGMNAWAGDYVATDYLNNDSRTRITRSPSYDDPNFTIYMFLKDTENGGGVSWDATEVEPGYQGPAIYIDGEYFASPLYEMNWLSENPDNAVNLWWDDKDNNAQTYTKEINGVKWVHRYYDVQKPDASCYFVSMYFCPEELKGGSYHSITIKGYLADYANPTVNRQYVERTFIFKAQRLFPSNPTVTMDKSTRQVTISGSLASGEELPTHFGMRMDGKAGDKFISNSELENSKDLEYSTSFSGITYTMPENTEDVKYEDAVILGEMYRDFTKLGSKVTCHYYDWFNAGLLPCIPLCCAVESEDARIYFHSDALKGFQDITDLQDQWDRILPSTGERYPDHFYGFKTFKEYQAYWEKLCTVNIEYSTDGVHWSPYKFETWDHINGTKYAQILVLKKGERVYFRNSSVEPTIFSLAPPKDRLNSCHFKISFNEYAGKDVRIGLSGNVMSLIDKYGTSTELPHDSCFYRLFGGDAGHALNTTYTSFPEFPAKTLTKYCYTNMFEYNNGNFYALELPATTLAEGCYQRMFSDCDMTATPELPATTLAKDCYREMFSECYYLTSAPQLPATTLAPGCYQDMFRKCNRMIVAPQLPVTTLARDCYREMFRECKGLKSAPYLPATELATGCYYWMFYGCSSLNHINVAFTEWRDDIQATTDWVNRTSDNGTFICDEALDTSVRNASRIPDGWTIQGTPADVLYLTANTDETTVALNRKGSPSEVTIEYSTDCCENWTPVNFSTATGTGTIKLAKQGLRVYFRNASAIATAFSNSSSDYFQFEVQGSAAASGNVMSLVDKSLAATTIPNAYCFYGLFSGCTGLTEAPKLPATTLAEGCYQSMFSGCTRLTEAPKLPATTLAEGCYQSMFSGCTGLTEAPLLPATKLAANCYQSMFSGCEKLSYIFVQFTDWNTSNNSTTDWVNGVAATGSFTCNSALDQSLEGSNYIPNGWTVHKTPEYLCLQSTSSAPATVELKKIKPHVTPVILEYSTDEGNSWTTVDFSVANTTGVITLANPGDKVYFRNPSDTPTGFSKFWDERDRDYGSNSYQFVMKEGQIVVSGDVMSLIGTCYTDEIPGESCFSNLFAGCTALTSAGDLKLPATTLTKNCYERMFDGCTSLTAAPELPATVMEIGCYYAMFYGCTSLTAAPKLPATVMKIDCYYAMFSGCSSLTEAPALPATTLADRCYGQMFMDCGKLTKAPELPATTLANGCYFDMFSWCKNLNYIKVGFTDWAGGTIPGTQLWTRNVTSSSGTFVCPSVLVTTFNDNSNKNYIPNGWKVTYDITANQDPDHKQNYYSTFYTNRKDYQLPDGVTAYTGVVDENTNVLNLTPIEDNIIPAGEGVILRLTQEDNTEKTAHFILEESSESGTWSGTNILSGFDTETTLGATDYALTLGQNGVGFYNWNGRALGAHKAYLTLSGSQPAPLRSFGFRFDDGTTTGIPATIFDQPQDDVIYNLQGQRVDESYKGLIIKNGQKVYNY